MRVLIVAVKTISLNIKLSKFELKIHIHTLFACIFTATEYFLYYFFKNPTVFIKLLTKSHYVDQSVTCYLHMNYIENKKKMFVSPRFFHFPITLDRIDMGVGVGMCPCPKFLLVKQGKYTHLLYFFLQMALSDLNDIRDTLPNHCALPFIYSILYLLYM